MKLLAGRANAELAQQIAKFSNIPLSKIIIENFADDEIFVRIDENVRGEDVFIIQSTCKPVNDNLMELLIIIDALRRGFAKSIIPVIPYFGYARQDRKNAPRTPISARLVANMLESAGAHRILTVDLHAGQIQGFFNIPVDNMYAMNLIVEDIHCHLSCTNDLMIISPDHGGVLRARALASKLGVMMAIIDKRRPEAGKAEVMNIIGNPVNKNCVLIDDMIDSGGTICKASEALKQAGALTVHAYATHGVLSNQAIDNINKSTLSSMVVSDTIPHANVLPTIDCKNNTKIRTFSIASLLGKAIIKIKNNQSVSSLFDIPS